MPIKIEVDGATELIAKFDKLQAQVTGLQDDLPREFMDWQREDMHRRWPKEETATMSVSTVVYPHGINHPKPREKRPMERRPAPRRIARPRGSLPRPILRAELFDKLRQRMTAMVEKALKWP